MFLKRENEFDTMRKELTEYYEKRYIQSSAKQLDDFTERAISSFQGNAVFDDSFIEQTHADAEKSLSDVIQKIEQVSKMSDGDVKQLYYKVFGRWAPIRL